MRKYFVLLAGLALLGSAARAQVLPPKSNWQGSLGGIRLFLTIAPDSVTHQPKVVLVSPDQGNARLPVSSFRITSDSLVISVPQIKGGYRGRFNAEKTEIAGVWTQGSSYPLLLKRVESLVTAVRPQTPRPPFPYVSEDVQYDDPARAIHYGATLTLPATPGKKFPVVVLISGSGQEDRDETIYGHRPFAVLADYLTRRGIAVLRVDDRGKGQSTGEVLRATSADFVKDVLVSVGYLKSRKEIDPAQIGLIGHSEGGMIAPLVALQSRDIAFIVSMAGVGVTGAELGTTQSRESLRAANLPVDQVNALAGLFGDMFQAANRLPLNQPLDYRPILNQWRSRQAPDLLEALKLGVNQPGEAGPKALEDRINLPWMRYFIQYDPAPVLGKITIPVLALNGSKDIQVAAADNLAGFERALQKAGNKDFKIVLLPGLNHLFQTANKGTVDEYEVIDETISPVALKTIGDWIDLHVKK